MTLDDWVALAMIWWRGRGRRAIADWLADPHGAARLGPGAALPAVAAGIAPRLAAPGRLAAARTRAQAALAAARAGGIAAVPWPDRRYPRLLAAIPDPPPVLWLRGDPAALDGPAVAVVGSRAGTVYACEVSRGLGADLAARGVTVVSGLARGVDSAAHRGVLAAGGRTAAVLGSGVDVVYPPEHAGLADAIARRGLLVSECPPGTTPRPALFPLRNRIISGLSRAVVVVEASERSGSLITARLALEQGREVMAVPGNVLSGRNRGAHALLRDGARIVESADDVADELGLGPAAGAAASPGGGGPREAQDAVLRHMDPGEVYGVDDLAARSGLDSGALLARLTDLELEGRVARAGAGRFVRAGTPPGRAGGAAERRPESGEGAGGPRGVRPAGRAEGHTCSRPSALQ